MCRYAQARGSTAVILIPPGVDGLARCSLSSDEPQRVQDHGKCPGTVAASAWVRADHKPDIALFFVKEESVPSRLLLPSE